MVLIPRGVMAAACAAAILAVSPSITSAQTPAPPGASVYIINLKDGDTVTGPFKVNGLWVVMEPVVLFAR